MSSNLVKLDQATQMLAEISSVDDARQLIDLAEAVRVYARQVDLGLEAQNLAAEIKLRAQRRAGEILQEMEKAPGRGERGPDGRFHQRFPAGTAGESPPTYSELGIGKKDASHWQALAAMPGENFEAEIAKTKARDAELTTAAMIRKAKECKREEARAEIAESGADVPPSDRWRVEVGNIRTYDPGQQFDFIITDPPYPREYLDLYSVLAQRALEWLKPGGLLLAMCGQSYLDEIVERMGVCLSYYWTGCYLTPGQPTPLRMRQVNTSWKPILAYIRPGDEYKGKIFGDVWVSDQNEKDFHEWGQSVSGMLSIIKQVCLPGQSILDPFCGAGTTGVAAIMAGCTFHGIDTDQERVNISRARIQEARCDAKTV